MPGRQAHGRSLLANTQSKSSSSNKKSKARSQKNALNAFGIAQEKFPTRQKRTPRARELDAETERKHAREEDDDSDEEEEEAPKRKKPKAASRPAADDDAEYGSDSEGNEWRLGGLAEDDEDSEIESDDAFGDSDNERFQGYSFGGSKSKNAEDDDSEDDSNDDEGQTLGADAIDLATALDQFEEESDEEPQGEDDSESEESDEEDSEDSEESEDDEQDASDEEADPEKLAALRGLITDYGGEQDDDAAENPSGKQKIGLSDLGLAGLNDPFMKKSVKLMNKEDKEKRPGTAKKLHVPLPKRQQDRLDRAAAYEKTNETLDRWTETVKQNRRAEHLIFPLPQNSATAGVDMTEIKPLTAKSAGNELESTIMSIMEQSGLSMEKKSKLKPQEFDEEGNLLTRKEALNRKRKERELHAREAKRAKRIKKIKSKAYHRVHRKQRERDLEDEEVDSEEEREAQDRRRALERVGQRHRESKWAKIGSKTKRAVWDDEFRAGLTEMARKDEELRRRKEGKKGGAGDADSDATSSSGDDSDDDDLRRQLDELEQEDDGPQSALMGLKFMQKAEATKKKANDDLIKQIRRDLDGDDAEDDSDGETGEVGRRQFGAASDGSARAILDTSRRASRREAQDSDDDSPVQVTTGKVLSRKAVKEFHAPVQIAASTAGQSSSRSGSRRKDTAGERTEELDFTVAQLKPKASEPQPTRSGVTTAAAADDDDEESGSETELHLPVAIRDQDMLSRAFAGEDVAGEFEREKAEVAEADDDKVIDNTLPGWGSWVGEGVSAREKKRHQGRFLTKVQGVKKKDRKDAKLERVIINEKRIKKNDRFLASQLPHPYESREQYERALRLPVGPEWMTKQTFQESTKPRVIVKQGIIAPISKPTA